MRGRPLLVGTLAVFVTIAALAFALSKPEVARPVPPCGPGSKLPPPQTRR
jgi:hypothetical protein